MCARRLPSTPHMQRGGKLTCKGKGMLTRYSQDMVTHHCAKCSCVISNISLSLKLRFFSFYFKPPTTVTRRAQRRRRAPGRSPVEPHGEGDGLPIKTNRNLIQLSSQSELLTRGIQLKLHDQLLTGYPTGPRLSVCFYMEVIHYWKRVWLQDFNDLTRGSFAVHKRPKMSDTSKTGGVQKMIMTSPVLKIET